MTDVRDNHYHRPVAAPPHVKRGDRLPASTVNLLIDSMPVVSRDPIRPFLAASDNTDSDLFCLMQDGSGDDAKTGFKLSANRGEREWGVRLMASWSAPDGVGMSLGEDKWWHGQSSGDLYIYLKIDRDNAAVTVEAASSVPALSDNIEICPLHFVPYDQDAEQLDWTAKVSLRGGIGITGFAE